MFRGFNNLVIVYKNFHIFFADNCLEVCAVKICPVTFGADWVFLQLYSVLCYFSLPNYLYKGYFDIIRSDWLFIVFHYNSEVSGKNNFVTYITDPQFSLPLFCKTNEC